MSTIDEPMSDVQGPLLIPALDLARMMQISTRTLWRMRSAGQLPEPVRLGGTVRWRMEEIKNWIDDGCPSQRGGNNGLSRR
jgi:predicted DNA-binding transcriptional regulator AlpA